MNASHPKPSSTKKGITQCLQRVTINPNIPMTDIQVYCHPNVRVGNWSEDWIAKKANVQEFLEKKENGQLNCMKMDRRVTWACEELPLSKHLGYHVPLVFQHVFTLGLVSCDISSIPLDSGLPPPSLPVSVSETLLKPMRRNVFQCKLHRPWHLSSLPSSPTSPCELMFGDHFYMVMTELIPEGPSKTLYLQSIPKSTLSYSPLGKQGQVSLTTQCTSACLWKLVPDDPYYLLEREGTPVQPGNRVCLQHCLSGHFLYIHPNIMYRNDFGLEYEAMTKPYTPHVAEQMYYQFVIWIDQPDQMMVVDDINAWQANVQLDKSKLDQVGEKGR